MDQLATMQTFIRVMETGSFSAVARKQGSSQPTVSKQVAALERSLGVQLFTRNTRRLSPTPAALAYYESCRGILEALEEANADVRSQERALSGTLRVNMPSSFSRLHVVPLLPGFLRQHPNIRMDLVMDDRYINLIEEGVDVALRIGRLSDSTLRARKIGTARRAIVGSPTYLKRHGEPRVPPDLKQHNCIVYSYSTIADHWELRGPRGPIRMQVKGNCQVNNAEAIRELALAGIGLASVPLWLVHRDIQRGKLKGLLCDFCSPPTDVHAVYPQGRYIPAKVNAFVDYLGEAFGRLDFLQ